MLNLSQFIAALLMWTGSALLFWLFVRGFQLRLSMTRWPRVRGIVREHQVHSHRGLHGPGHHRPKVIVEYSSAAVKHRIRCDSPTRMGFAHKEGARSIMAQFPVGEAVEVYVDPKNPQRAFLYPPETPVLVILLLGSLFLFFVGVGMS